MSHKHILLIACAGLFLLIGGTIFIFNYKKILSNISNSLKDPQSGNWSPKVVTACAVAGVIIIAQLVWVKYAFLHENFDQLQNLLLIDYGYLSVAFGLRTIEKMQATKLDATKPATE